MKRKKNSLRLIFTLVLTIILQNTVLSRITVLGIHPNIYLPVTICLAIGFGCYVGGFSGILFGFSQDMLFTDTLGINALIYFVCGFIIGTTRAGLNKEDIRTGLILTVVSSFIYVLFNQIIYGILGNPMNFTNYLKGPIFIEIIFNVILYILVFKIFKRLFSYPKYRF